MKLTPMVDYVLEQSNIQSNNGSIIDNARYKKATKNYAKFLKQLLKLEMFVPCDDEGNVLEFVSKDWVYKKGLSKEEQTFRLELLQSYEKAQEKVLFKTNFNTIRPDMFYEKDFFIQGIGKVDTDWQFMELNNNYIIRMYNIEDLSHLGIELTENAIKELKIYEE